MALLPIRIFPDPVLKERAVEVTRFDSDLHTFLDSMRDTMYAAKGVGLAAPQVGVLQRVAVVDTSDDGTGFREFINPVIVTATGDVSSEEGCLSIPEYRDTIRRHELVTVRAVDRHGEPFEVEAVELLAMCLQHEIDHLDGVLFIDRLSRLKRELFRRWHRKQLSRTSS